ncbi:hypothetical protein ACGGAQ_32480 [Micromonospora sp. NPDC047557]|uniref:hypothetical protein n=1 Tax=Micromonospora sp. NPDC047557 TaxID=3364250 RepID=UPI00371FE57E
MPAHPIRELAKDATGRDARTGRRTRQEIHDAPPYDPESASPEYRDRVGRYYADPSPASPEAAPRVT